MLLTRPGDLHEGHPLAVVRYGRPVEAASPGLAIEAPFAPLTDAGLDETWFVAEPPRSGRCGRITFSATDDVLFGALRADASAEGDLEPATLALYGELLGAASELGYPHLLRIWNAVPRINADEPAEGGAPLERYKLFCRGRSHAFQKRYGAGYPDRLPAASAVGGDGNELVVYFIAAREHGQHLENPRQVAAWAYPREYGPRSPSFARATVAPPGLGEVLFVSGTASVVGHRSVHPGDVLAQLDETLRNIAALLEQRGRALDRLQMLKVYVRHAHDAPAVRERLEQSLGGDLPVLYVHGEICRRELLLEIEGTAT